MAILNGSRDLCLASAFAFALTGVAGAADLAVKTPMFAPVPVFSWTGVYVGIGGGTGWGNNEYTWNQDATLAAVAAQMPNPGTLPQLGPTQGSLPISGGFFGGQIGGNWQVERAARPSHAADASSPDAHQAGVAWPREYAHAPIVRSVAPCPWCNCS